MTFLGGFLGAICGCIAIGVLFVIIGGAATEYEPCEKKEAEMPERNVSR